MKSRLEISLPPTHVYVGRAQCGCVYMIRNDDHDKDTAKAVAEVVAEGGYVDHVTWEEYTTIVKEEETFMMCPCPHQDVQTEMELLEKKV